MLSFSIALFVVLHGLVHLWFVNLSQGVVSFQPSMGWSGKSWALSNLMGDPSLHSLASALYLLATVVFAASGVGILIHADWWRPLLVVAAALSSVIILLFWDGSTQLLVEKGLIGLFIDAAILIALLVIKWPSTAQ